MEILNEAQPPSGLRRLVWRLPIHLYRMRLGWLLGRRFLLLTHTGRISGQPRQVVIEVVEHDKTTGDYVVASGFGRKSDWYRNVLKTPQAAICIGTRAFSVTGQPLSTAEGEEIMARWGRAHPRTARRLCRIMGFEVDGSEADYRAVGRQVPLLRFTPG